MNGLETFGGESIAESGRSAGCIGMTHYRKEILRGKVSELRSDSDGGGPLGVNTLTKEGSPPGRPDGSIQAIPKVRKPCLQSGRVSNNYIS